MIHHGVCSIVIVVHLFCLLNFTTAFFPLFPGQGSVSATFFRHPVFQPIDAHKQNPTADQPTAYGLEFTVSNQWQDVLKGLQPGAYCLLFTTVLCVRDKH